MQETALTSGAILWQIIYSIMDDTGEDGVLEQKTASQNLIGYLCNGNNRCISLISRMLPYPIFSWSKPQRTQLEIETERKQDHKRIEDLIRKRPKITRFNKQQKYYISTYI